MSTSLERVIAMSTGLFIFLAMIGQFDKTIYMVVITSHVDLASQLVTKCRHMPLTWHIDITFALLCLIDMQSWFVGRYAKTNWLAGWPTSRFVYRLVGSWVWLYPEIMTMMGVDEWCTNHPIAWWALEFDMRDKLDISIFLRLNDIIPFRIGR
jgi:hypothetical protein